jgi:chromosome segregation ATPase
LVAAFTLARSFVPAQAQCQAAEETKHTFSGSWEFSASQLVLAELEIEDCNRIIEELSAEVADRDDELEQLDRDMAELERAVLLAEKARREQFGECTKELRAAERDTIRREKKLRERQQEYAELKAAIAQAAARKDSNGGGSSSSSSAEQQQQYREERLCRLVEKLLEDVEKGNGEIERKNGVLRGIAEHIASTAAAAAAATSAETGDASEGHP